VARVPEGGIETDAVVGDLELETRPTRVVAGEAHQHPRCPCVLHDVAQSLLGQPVEVLLGRRTQDQLLLGRRKGDGQPFLGLEGGEVLAKGGHEPFLGQSVRPQLEDQRPHLRQCPLGELTDVGDALSDRALRIMTLPLEGELEGSGLKSD